MLLRWIHRRYALISQLECSFLLYDVRNNGLQDTWNSENHNEMGTQFRQMPKYALRIIKWQYAHLMVIYWIDSNMQIFFFKSKQWDWSSREHSNTRMQFPKWIKEKYLRKSARYSDTSKDPMLKNTRGPELIHFGMAYTQLNVNNLIIAFKLVRNTNIRDHCASINSNRFWIFSDFVRRRGNDWRCKRTMHISWKECDR